MKKQVVLLTGATGFLGSYLLESLISQGYFVVVLKRSTSDLYRIAHLAGSYKSYNVDVRPLEDAFKEQKIECIVHTACHYGRGGELLSEIVESNLLFGLRVLDAGLKFNVDTFINTDTLLQEGVSAYSLSKRQFTEWLFRFSEKMQMVNLKIEHMYGVKDDVTKFVPWIVSQFKENVSEIKLTKGEQKRDFIYIDDVVSAYLTILRNTARLGKFNEFDVCTGRLITVKSFVEQLKNAYKDRFKVVNTRLNFGALPYREGELMEVEADNKSLKELGWHPEIDIECGMEKILKEYG